MAGFLFSPKEMQTALRFGRNRKLVNQKRNFRVFLLFLHNGFYRYPE